MVNITQVNLTSGVPTGPAGPATVSTLDNLIGTAGAPVGNVQSIQGITSMVPLKVDGSAVTQPISGTITATISSGTITANQGAPPWTVKPDGTLWTLTGTAANVNVTNGALTVSGTVTVQQATASNLNATVTGTVAVSSGTVTANQGGAPWTMKPDGTVWTMAANSANVNVTNTVPVSGTVGISGTVNASCTQNGTWTVQPGNTANTTPWLMTVNQGGNSAVVKPASTGAAAADPSLVVNISPNSPPVAMTQSGSWTVQRIQTATNTNLIQTRVVAAATTNATSLKASAGNIAAIDLFNVAAYMVFLKLYNKASAPTVGTDTPVWTIPIPASGGFSIDFSQGEYFSTGIAFAITKLQADSDTTVLVAGDVTGRIKWV